MFSSFFFTRAAFCVQPARFYRLKIASASPLRIVARFLCPRTRNNGRHEGRPRAAIHNMYIGRGSLCPYANKKVAGRERCKSRNVTSSSLIKYRAKTNCRALTRCLCRRCSTHASPKMAGWPDRISDRHRAKCEMRCEILPEPKWED